MTIPHPEFTSWMHERQEIKEESRAEREERWKRQPVVVRAVEAVLSRVMTRMGWLSGNRRWVTLKTITAFFRWYFRIFNRFRVHGRENVPKHGAIFLVNHPGVMDPPILMAALPPNTFTGLFVSWGNGWFADMCEKLYGMVQFRTDSRDSKIERMIRAILLKNAYFAIWPEGHPTFHIPTLVERGFSSIVRVYAAINHDRDRIPFVPVLIRGQGLDMRVFTGRRDINKRFTPIDVHFLKPVFVPRKWLKKPEEGGKTPREIIDKVWRLVARKNGQEDFIENPRLTAKKRFHANRERIEKELGILPEPRTLEDPASCQTCGVIGERVAGKTLEKGRIREAIDCLETITFCKNEDHVVYRCPDCGAYFIHHRHDKPFIQRRPREGVCNFIVRLSFHWGFTGIRIDPPRLKAGGQDQAGDGLQDGGGVPAQAS